MRRLLEYWRICFPRQLRRLVLFCFFFFVSWEPSICSLEPEEVAHLAGNCRARCTCGPIPALNWVTEPGIADLRPMSLTWKTCKWTASGPVPLPGRNKLRSEEPLVSHSGSVRRKWSLRPRASWATANIGPNQPHPGTSTLWPVQRLIHGPLYSWSGSEMRRLPERLR